MYKRQTLRKDDTRVCVSIGFMGIRSTYAIRRPADWLVDDRTITLANSALMSVNPKITPIDRWTDYAFTFEPLLSDILVKESAERMVWSTPPWLESLRFPSSIAEGTPKAFLIEPNEDALYAALDWCFADKQEMYNGRHQTHLWSRGSRIMSHLFNDGSQENEFLMKLAQICVGDESESRRITAQRSRNAFSRFRDQLITLSNDSDSTLRSGECFRSSILDAKHSLRSFSRNA